MEIIIPIGTDPRYIPDSTGVLKFTKKYKKELIDSGDEDYIALSNMEGQRIDFMHIPVPVLYKRNIEVNICRPCPLHIPKIYFKDVQRLTDEDTITRL